MTQKGCALEALGISASFAKFLAQVKTLLRSDLELLDGGKVYIWKM